MKYYHLNRSNKREQIKPYLKDNAASVPKALSPLERTKKDQVHPDLPEAPHISARLGSVAWHTEKNGGNKQTWIQILT